MSMAYICLLGNQVFCVDCEVLLNQALQVFIQVDFYLKLAWMDWFQQPCSYKYYCLRFSSNYSSLLSSFYLSLSFSRNSRNSRQSIRSLSSSSSSFIFSFSSIACINFCLQNCMTLPLYNLFSLYFKILRLSLNQLIIFQQAMNQLTRSQSKYKQPVLKGLNSKDEELNSQQYQEEIEMNLKELKQFTQMDFKLEVLIKDENFIKKVKGSKN